MRAKINSWTEYSVYNGFFVLYFFWDSKCGILNLQNTLNWQDILDDHILRFGEVQLVSFGSHVWTKTRPKHRKLESEKKIQKVENVKSPYEQMSTRILWSYCLVNNWKTEKNIFSPFLMTFVISAFDLVKFLWELLDFDIYRVQKYENRGQIEKKIYKNL